MNWNQNKQFGFNPGQYNTQPNYNQPFAMNYGAPAPQNYYQTSCPPQYPQRSFIEGRMVQNINEVVPNDVKMDGSCSFFPVNDGSAIFAMRWSQDGSRIEQVKYIPEQTNQNPEAKTFEQLVMERLDSLEDIIRNQNRYHNGKKQFKKEESLNEPVDKNNNDQNGSK